MLLQFTIRVVMADAHCGSDARLVRRSHQSRLIDHPPVVLAAADLVGGIQACEDEFDATGADGCIGGGVDFEGFVPGGRDSLEAIGVVR